MTTVLNDPQGTALGRQGFKDWLRGLKNQGVMPVLCVDDFDELLERQEQFPKDFYDNLRSAIGENCLMMIVASQEMLDLYSKQKQITSDFFNVFQMESLNEGFSEQEAMELVSLTNAAGEGLTGDVKSIALKWGKHEPFLLQLAALNLWEMQQYGKSQKWAEQRFKQQANRFKFQPKSKFLGFLFRSIAKVGKISVWFVENKDDLKDFWCGLFVIGVALGIVILFIFGFLG